MKALLEFLLPILIGFAIGYVWNRFPEWIEKYKTTKKKDEKL